MERTFGRGGANAERDIFRLDPFGDAVQSCGFPRGSCSGTGGSEGDDGVAAEITRPFEEALSQVVPGFRRVLTHDGFGHERCTERSLIAYGEDAKTFEFSRCALGDRVVAPPWTAVSPFQICPIAKNADGMPCGSGMAQGVDVSGDVCRVDRRGAGTSPETSESSESCSQRTCEEREGP